MFAEDAHLASATSLPIPRGIAMHIEPTDDTPAIVATVQALVADRLAGWSVRAVPGLDGWYELTPPMDAEPVPLGPFWDTVRTLRSLPGVRDVDPLFLVANPQPAGEVETEAFALGFVQEQFGLWGLPYDPEVARRIETVSASSKWHLSQLRVPEAWQTWRARHPDKLPGEGVVVGHPDTGFSDHVELKERFVVPGRSFLRDASGDFEREARDDLVLIQPGFLQNPGHGTSTASVIASGEHDETDSDIPEAYGVAPGARVLPLRVSRSVVIFDFSNVGNAILHAASNGADVISMSLGGPGYSSFLRACIRRAQEQGVIIVSAAGNNVPTVVFPAAYPEVVAVAATHAADGPWRFTGIGTTVDIAAPGEQVWCARASLKQDGSVTFAVDRGTGTSFSTACVAGLACLWLSYHGGRQAVADQYGGRRDLVPYVFQYLLATTANSDHELFQEGKYGAGIANAEALLAADLPPMDVVERFAEVTRAQPVNVFSAVSGLFGGLFGLAERPVVSLASEDAADVIAQSRPEPTETAVVQRTTKAQDDAQAMLRQLLGDKDRTDRLAPELLMRIVTDRLLLVGFQRWRNGQSLLPLLDRLLASPSSTAAGVMAGRALSDELADVLRQRREREANDLRALHPGELVPGVSITLPPQDGAAGRISALPPRPEARRLRAYAMDPSLGTRLATAAIHQVTIPTRWEEVRPGPVGEYLEVVDVDPASGCAYSPVDLNHPHVLGQDGLAPSESNPQFHQQMVYAVAMNTIHRFELALSRPIFWSPLRPWQREHPEERSQFTAESLAPNGLAPSDPTVPASVASRDRYVQRLRVYPHALREANAYYSPRKRALLFGYFPGSDDDTGRHYPGGMVFSCLSHDIIAHETTHALIDGMHPYLNEPSNHDVWAFHEAFADIVAMFQHFTYPEVLRHQIANTRGDLEANNFLAQLAQQFGEATGQRGALRDALGSTDPKTGVWTRRPPDPRALRTIEEPHRRGSILVAAIFDAFLQLYNDRVADLIRISSGGTGILPAGRLHPDLVNRLAIEASSAAEEVLRVCIRAMDYIPPVDLTFGEFLRALITADFELPRGAARTNRIAFIDAFRSWGIYPRDVPSLSEESLRWRDQEDRGISFLSRSRRQSLSARDERILNGLMRAIDEWQPGRDRSTVFQSILNAQGALHYLLAELQAGLPPGQSLIPGLDLSGARGFSIGNLRPVRRSGRLGEARTEMVVEVVQTHRPPGGGPTSGVPCRGGATLIVDLQSWQIRYIVYKRLWEHVPSRPDEAGVLAPRFDRNRGQRADAEARAAWSGEESGSLAGWLASTYACEERRASRKKPPKDEPFALLHQSTL
jgi:subtilisin family serine protease